jgi:hypothetical protein
MKKTIVLLTICLGIIFGMGSVCWGNPAKIALTPEEKIRLDTFFSNFSETHLKDFMYGQLDENELIRFGLRHLQINKYSVMTAKIPAADVDYVTNKYFGRVVGKHHNAGYWFYENGIYKKSMIATCDMPPFSQIDELWDNGDGTFTALVSVYWAYDGWPGDQHGSPEEWKKADKRPPTLSGKFRAIIRPLREVDSERYILVEYLREN